MWRPSQIENEESDRAHLQRAGDARHPVRTEPLPTTLTIRLIKLALMGLQPREPAETATGPEGEPVRLVKKRVKNLTGIRHLQESTVSFDNHKDMIAADDMPVAAVAIPIAIPV